MFHPMMNRAPTIWSQTCFPLPSIAPPGLVRPNAAQPCEVAKRPVPIPPTKAPTKWVWKTSSVSSTRWKTVSLRPAMFIETQGMVPDPKPRAMAPQPATTPAAGVMATRPVIMPWMAPMTEGWRK